MINGDGTTSGYKWEEDSQTWVGQGLYLGYLDVVEIRYKEQETDWVAYAQIAGELALSFTPLGPLLDAKDIYNALESGDPTEIALSLIAIIPGGDIIKHAHKLKKT